MKIIIGKSAVHGNKEIFVDDEDFEILNKKIWSIYKPRKSKTFYAMRTENKKYVAMHRLIMNAPKNKEVDHKNGNGLDNTKNNLRICEHKENLLNSDRKNMNGYKGIYFKKSHNRYVARVIQDGKTHHLGMHETAEKAAIAYNKKAAELFGEFARLNNVPDGATVVGLNKVL